VDSPTSDQSGAILRRCLTPPQTSPQQPSATRRRLDGRSGQQQARSVPPRRHRQHRSTEGVASASHKVHARLPRNHDDRTSYPPSCKVRAGVRRSSRRSPEEEERRWLEKLEERVKGGGRRSTDEEERRWLEKLEEREAQRASGPGGSGALPTAAQFAAQTTAALHAIQQHVDSRGAVAVFDSIDGDRTGRVTAGQLARALGRMRVHTDGEPEARVLSRMIIRAVNQRQGSTRRTLSLDAFCHLFEQEGGSQGGSHGGWASQHGTPCTACMAEDRGGSTPPSAVFVCPLQRGSPPGSHVGSHVGSPMATAADVRQQQRYLDYLLRCQQQGVEPAPEVTAMAHEMMASAKEALMLVASVHSVEQQLGIAEDGGLGILTHELSEVPQPRPQAPPVALTAATLSPPLPVTPASSLPPQPSPAVCSPLDSAPVTPPPTGAPEGGAPAVTEAVEAAQEVRAAAGAARLHCAHATGRCVEDHPATPCASSKSGTDGASGAEALPPPSSAKLSATSWPRKARHRPRPRNPSAHQDKEEETLLAIVNQARKGVRELARDPLPQYLTQDA